MTLDERDGDAESDDDGDVPFWDWAPADDAEATQSGTGSDPGPDPTGTGPSGTRPTGTGPSGEPLAAGAFINGVPVARSEASDGPESIYEELTRAEGIGYRLGNLGGLFGHTRMSIWRRRAVIAVVIGALVTILVNWQVGVTLAILAAMVDTVIQSRVAGAAPPVPGAKKPTKPQRMTQKQLQGLEKAGYRALHSRLIPDSEEHIDHLVIGPAGVFSIDSEWWDKNLPIRTKNARQLWLGPFSMKERLEHALWEAGQAADLLSAATSSQVRVRSAMAVYGPKIPWDVTTIRDVDVFSGKRLRNYLRRYARRTSARPLSATEIDRIYRAAHTAFPHLDPGIAAPPLPSTPK